MNFILYNVKSNTLRCKELVLATVRAFFDLIEPETGQVSHVLIQCECVFKVFCWLMFLFSSQRVLRSECQCWTITSLDIQCCSLEEHRMPLSLSQVCVCVHMYIYRLISFHHSWKIISVSSFLAICIRIYSFILPAPPEAWKEVNTLRLFYSAPKVTICFIISGKVMPAASLWTLH